jgi:signal recognition particle subunit SRP68
LVISLILRKIYDNLSIALQGDESQVFYSQKVDEIIPNIRYCNYNLGDETAKKDLVEMKLKSTTGAELAENIDVLISQTKENQITSFSEVTWRSKLKLQIKNEKVKLFLLNVQEYEKQIQTASGNDVKISIYENILKESVDVIQIIRDELKLDSNFQLLQRGQPLPLDDKPSNMLLLFSYLTWTRMNKTIERNLLMIETYKTSLNNSKQQDELDNKQQQQSSKQAKPQDIVRIYDIILQNLKDLANLPGLSNDKQFQNENDFMQMFYKMFRAYYISLFYLSSKKYKEAVGFIFKVEQYLKQFETTLKSFNNKSDLNLNELQQSVKELSIELNQSKYKLQSAAILETSDLTDSTSTELSREQLDKIVIYFNFS